MQEHDHAHGTPGQSSHDHSHDHSHGGAHSHGPGHVHAPKDFGRAFAIGIALNTAFVAIEAGYGLWSNSMALLADAGHNLSDVLGLLVAWGAATLSRRQPSDRFTYGWRNSSILAALFNALFLLLAVGVIAWEAAWRLFYPEPVAGVTVIIVAGIGILINGFTAYLFAGGRSGDINIEGAYLHMFADAAVSGGVVIAGLLMITSGWEWIDPAVSLVIVVVIVWQTWRLLRESVTMSLAGVPAAIDVDQVRRFLLAEHGVTGLHDLHIWPMSTTEIALTAHLVIPDGHPGDAVLFRLAVELRDRFGIVHPTLQIERGERTCPLEPAQVV